MASKTLDDLLSAGTLDGTELAYLEQQSGGQWNSRKVTLEALSSFLGVGGEWAPNVTADADVYIPAQSAMTIDEGVAAIGGATITYEKSTAAAPSTFNPTTLPATLEAGAWLKVSFTSVTGFAASHLVRTA